MNDCHDGCYDGGERKVIPKYHAVNHRKNVEVSEMRFFGGKKRGIYNNCVSKAGA